MRLNRYSLLSLLAGTLFLLPGVGLAQNSSAQLQAVEASPVVIGEDLSRPVPVDSIFYDTGDGSIQFVLGFGEQADYAAALKFTAPEDFTLTRIRTLYRTEGGTEPGGIVDPLVRVYDGSGATPAESKLLADTTAPMGPFAFRYIELPEPLEFSEDDEFFIALFFEGVNFPMGTEAGDPSNPDIEGRSFSSGDFGAEWTEGVDVLTFNGLNEDDTPAADGTTDIFFIRAITDDDDLGTSNEGTASSLRALSPVYPNPVQDRGTMTLVVDQAEMVRATIHDVLGREVGVLHDGTVGAGQNHILSIDAHDLVSGLYFVSVRGESFSATRKVVVTR